MIRDFRRFESAEDGENRSIGIDKAERERRRKGEMAPVGPPPSGAVRQSAASGAQQGWQHRQQPFINGLGTMKPGYLDVINSVHDLLVDGWDDELYYYTIELKCPYGPGQLGASACTKVPGKLSDISSSIRGFDINLVYYKICIECLKPKNTGVDWIDNPKIKPLEFDFLMSKLSFLEELYSNVVIEARVYYMPSDGKGPSDSIKFSDFYQTDFIQLKHQKNKANSRPVEYVEINMKVVGK